MKKHSTWLDSAACNKVIVAHKDWNCSVVAVRGSPNWTMTLGSVAGWDAADVLLVCNTEGTDGLLREITSVSVRAMSPMVPLSYTPCSKAGCSQRWELRRYRSARSIPLRRSPCAPRSAMASKASAHIIGMLV
eukprot:CAMPEP_0179219138 /NCGR_PEP_ID=MMETSP0797-20121207/4868_1 /TAXON_ID=47934 /ORGANISM="Dinophysis acuminata, Strain DAEP01" /LENGTH=132 /DNA_ID=CAMNT_0020925575 /DNA_START=239 /DNA_END=637 /DNA_ORIENTATION=+